MKNAIIKNGEIVDVILLEEGADWSPPEGCTAMELDSALAANIPYAADPPPAPADLMSSARSAMAAILDALNMDDRMELQNLRVQVEAALNLGQVDLAYYIVTNAAIPAHLETVRTQILALFPSA